MTQDLYGESGRGGTSFVAIQPGQRLVVLAALACYAIAVLVGIQVSGRPLGVSVAVAFIFALIVQFWPLMDQRRDVGWLHPVVFTSFALSFPLFRSFPVYAFGLEWNQGLPGLPPDQLDRVVVYALVITAISRAAYYAGFYSPGRSQPCEIAWSNWTRPGLKAGMIAAVGSGIVFAYLVSQGGLSQYLSFLNQGRSILVNANLLFGEWAVVAHVGVLACLVWWAAVDRAEYNPLFWLSAAFSLVLVHVATGSRSAVIEALMLAWIVRALKHQRLKVLSLGLLLGSTVLLIGLLGVVRTAAQNGSLSLATLTEGGATEYARLGTEELLVRAGESNPLYPILARVPDDVGLLYGRSYAMLAVWWVPRRVWPGKPRSTGAIVGETFLMTDAAVPPGPIGEAYWNFHIPGVIVVFFLFGLVHRWFAAVLTRSSRAAPAVVLYALTLVSLSPDVLGLVHWGQMAIGLLLILTLLGVFPPRRLTQIHNLRCTRIDPLRSESCAQVR